MAQTVKNLPAVQETQVQSLGQEDPLEEEMATTTIFLPGKSHGQRSLVSYSPCCRKKIWTWSNDWEHTYIHHTESTPVHCNSICNLAKLMNIRITSIIQISGGYGLFKFFFFLGCGAWQVGVQFSHQGWNPGPLHWKHKVLTTGPPGKSPEGRDFCQFHYWCTLST